MQPPARLRGTIKSDSTGQMRSSNHPPGCGAVCSRICKFGLEFDFTKSRSLGAQLGCAVWARSLGAQSGRAAWVRSLGAQLGCAAWVRSLGAQFGCAVWVDGLTGKRTLDQAGTPSVRRWPFPSGCTRDIRKCDGNPRPQNRAIAAHPIGEAEPSAVRGDDLGGDGKTQAKVRLAAFVRPPCARPMAGAGPLTPVEALKPVL